MLRLCLKLLCGAVYTSIVLTAAMHSKTRLYCSLACPIFFIQAMGRKPEAEESFSKALQLVKGVQSSSCEDLAVLNKCRGLLSFLESRQMQ